MKRTYHITDTFDDGTTRQMLLDTECIKHQVMIDAKEINYICNLDNPEVMARLLTEHKVAEARIVELEAQLRQSTHCVVCDSLVEHPDGALHCKECVS